jgi:hypothetical protein
MSFFLICLVGIAGLGFDLWRAFDDNDVLGRPWPNVRREANPSLFWAIQGFRAVVLLGFVGLGAAWMLDQF